MKTNLLISDTIQDSRYDGRFRKLNRILSKKREEFNREKKREIANRAILANALVSDSCDANKDVIQSSSPKQEPSKSYLQ